MATLGVAIAGQKMGHPVKCPCPEHPETLPAQGLCCRGHRAPFLVVVSPALLAELQLMFSLLRAQPHSGAGSGSPMAAASGEGTAGTRLLPAGTALALLGGLVYLGTLCAACKRYVLLTAPPLSLLGLGWGWGSLGDTWRMHVRLCVWPS